MTAQDSPRLDLLSQLPHQFPFHMIDRIVSMEPGKFVRAYRHVSRGDPMLVEIDGLGWALPRLLVIEAIGQAALAMMLAVEPEHEPVLPLFVGCDAHFDGDVPAGCRLDVAAQTEKRISTGAVVFGWAEVAGVGVARMKLTAAIGPSRLPEGLG